MWLIGNNGLQKKSSKTLVVGGVGGWGQNCGIFRFVIFNFILLEEISDKMKLSPSTLEKLCYTPWNFQKPRLSRSPLPWKCQFFFNLPLEFSHLFFQYTPKKFQVFSPPHVWIFFWNTYSCYATKIVIWFYGWNSPVDRAIPKKNTNRWGLVDIIFWKAPGILDLSL